MSLLLLALTPLSLTPISSTRAPDDTLETTTLVAADVLHFRSEVLGEERTVRVALPASYGETARPYPVAYVLDGEYSGFLTTVNASRFLAGLGLAPELIVVGVHNVRREDDMTPEGLEVPQFDFLDRRADAFLEFFGEELFPRIETRYRAQPIRTLVGHSHGGIFGTYALAARPDLFRWHLAIDAPLYLADSWLLRNLASRLEERPEALGRLVAIDARGEVSEGWRDLSRRAPAGFLVRRASLEGETHESVFYGAIYRGLRELFADYALEEVDVRSLDELHRDCAALAPAYGASPAPSRRVLLLQAENHRLMGYGREARQLIEETIALYGDSPALQELLAEAREVEAAGPPSETVADVLATPRATPEEIEPFLGAWELVSPGDPRNLLRIEVDGDAVVGTFQLADPSGRRGLTLEVDVIEVLADGRLGFGYVNNMRPKGVLYYTVERRSDDRLVGGMSFRGVTVEPRMERILAERVLEFRRHGG